MSRDALLYLDDLIASAQKIGRLTAGRGMPAFAADEAVFDAVLFNLQIIGEAIKQLPEQLRMKLTPAHRSAPARLRDLIAHHYFAIDAEIIWDVVQHHLPALLAEALLLQQSLDAADGA